MADDMKEISELVKIYQEMKEAKLHRELEGKEAEHRMEMDRIRTLASIDNVNALIAVSGPVQSQMLAELARTETLKSYTPQQILAQAAEKNPQTTQALAEMMQALGPDKLGEAERLLAEVKESARLNREDYQQNLQTLAEMFRKALDAVRDTAIGQHGPE